MGTTTYYVTLAFMRSEEGDILACEPKEARSADQAIRMAKTVGAREPHCGAIAFSPTGDPALGDFEDAVVLKTVGEVDEGLLKSLVILVCARAKWNLAADYPMVVPNYSASTRPRSSQTIHRRELSVHEHDADVWLGTQGIAAAIVIYLRKILSDSRVLRGFQ